MSDYQIKEFKNYPLGTQFTIELTLYDGHTSYLQYWEEDYLIMVGDTETTVEAHWETYVGSEKTENNMVLLVPTRKMFRVVITGGDEPLDIVVRSYSADATVPDIPDVIENPELPETPTPSTLVYFVTDDELSSTLLDYPTSDELSSTLLDYPTSDELSSSIADFVTDDELSSSIADFVTDDELSSSIADFVTDDELSSSIADFVTDDELSSSIADFVTDDELSSSYYPLTANPAGYITTETDSQTLSYANTELSISNGNTITLDDVVTLSGDQTIAGEKTFNDKVYMSLPLDMFGAGANIDLQGNNLQDAYGTVTIANPISVNGGAEFAGNVGIGTASAPTHILQMEADGYDARFVIDTPNYTSNPGMEFRHSRADSARALIRSSSTGAGEADLSFWTSTGSTNTQALTILGGNVGIGTDTPATELDVNGSITTNATLTASTLASDYWYSQGAVAIFTFSDPYVYCGSELVMNGAGYGIDLVGNSLKDTYGTVNIADPISMDAGDGITWGTDDAEIVGGAVADTLTLKTAGSDAVTIDSAGNVGIGTTSPAAKLDILGDNAATVAQLITLASAQTADAFQVKSNAGTELVTIDGTDGSMSVGGGALTKTGGGGTLQINSTNPYATLNLKSTTADWGFFTASDGSFLFRNTVGGFTDPFVIEKSVPSNTIRVKTITGNVGIGTSTPSEKLEVSGNAQISTKLAVGGPWNTFPSKASALYGMGQDYSLIGASTTADDTRKYTRFAGGAYSNEDEPVIAFTVDASSDATATLSIGGTTSLGNSPTDLAFYTSNGNLSVTGVKRMYFDRNGQAVFTAGTTVGIGVVNPTVELDVAGDVKVSGDIQANGSDVQTQVKGIVTIDTETYTLVASDAGKHIRFTYTLGDVTVTVNDGVHAAKDIITLKNATGGNTLIVAQGTNVTIDAPGLTIPDQSAGQILCWDDTPAASQFDLIGGE